MAARGLRMPMRDLHLLFVPSKVFVRVLLLPGLLLFGLAQGHGQEPRLRVDVRLVLLNTHVARPDGRPVADLPKEQFHVYESGFEQPVSVFLAGETPVHVALLMDASGSTREHIDSLKKAAQQFVERFGPQDHLALYEVSSEIRRVVPFSQDHRALLQVIRRMRTESERGKNGSQGEVMTKGTGTTLLYDAINAIERDFPPEAERRAILAFTDTIDEGSSMPMENLAQGMLRGSTTLYTVAPDRAALRTLAEEAIVGFRPRGFRPEFFSTASKRNVWVVHIDESEGDSAITARRRYAAARLFQRMPQEKRIWLLRLLPRGRLQLLGRNSFSISGDGKAQPLTPQQAQEALGDPGLPEGGPAKRSEGRGPAIRIEGEREMYITGGRKEVVRHAVGQMGFSPEWLAEKTFLPDQFADAAEMDAAIDTFLQDPKEYVELLTGRLERQLNEIRDGFQLLVEDTGGILLEFRKPSDLKNNYEQIAQRIKASYTLGYYTNARRGRHPLRVVVDDPGLEAHSRKMLVLEP